MQRLSLDFRPVMWSRMSRGLLVDFVNASRVVQNHHLPFGPFLLVSKCQPSTPQYCLPPNQKVCCDRVGASLHTSNVEICAHIYSTQSTSHATANPFVHVYVLLHHNIPPQRSKLHRSPAEERNNYTGPNSELILSARIHGERRRHLHVLAG